MKKLLLFLIPFLLAGILLTPSRLEAQGLNQLQSGSAPADAGAAGQGSEQTETSSFWPFQTQGSASFGYRFTDVTGYQPMYLELLDLQSGPRLTDFNMFSQATTPNPFVDDFSLTMSGLGGDPYPTAQLTVSKNNLYDLVANWSQSYFDYSPDQQVITPGGIPGLTDEHEYSTVRKFGSIDLRLHATNHLRFNFNYYRTSDTGATWSGFAPDYLGAGYTTWDYYAEGSPYVLYAPENDEANRFTGGIDYTFHSWSFHYSLGYQTLSDSMTFNNTTSPEYSFDTSATFTANTPLTLLSMDQYRRLTSPISQFSYAGKPLSKLDLRGSYIYYRYSGPASMDEIIDGIAPTSIAETSFTPYTVSQQVRANVKEPDHVFDQGLTYHINRWWAINTDYRYSRDTEDSLGVFDGLLDGSLLASNGSEATLWRDGLSDFDFNMVFTPIPSLLISPGLSWDNSNVEALYNGVANPAQTLRWNTVEPAFSAYWQPSKRFSLRGDVRTLDNGASYTAITPQTETTGNVVARLKLTDSLSLNDNVNLNSSSLLATGYQDRVRANATLLNYALNPTLSLFGGFSYDSILALGDIVFADGPSESLRDQEIDHVWQAGFQLNPGHRFGIQFTGNYDRTTGVGEISDNLPPAYGPETWPYATGTVFYEFPKAGRLSIDLQRTYYKEQIVTGNNFGAEVLMIKWTRNF